MNISPELIITTISILGGAVVALFWLLVKEKDARRNDLVQLCQRLDNTMTALSSLVKALVEIKGT